MPSAASSAAPAAGAPLSGITLTPDLVLVLLSIACQAIVNLIHVILVVRARKQYKVEYPHFYAPHDHKNKKEFDSVHRAHAQFLENQFGVTAQIIITALTFSSKWAWVCGFGWCFGRVIYAIGYAMKGPSGRMPGGIISHLFDLPLMVMSFWGPISLVL